MRSRSAVAAASLIALASLATGPQAVSARPVGDPVAAQLPNLVPLPPRNVGVGSADAGTGTRALRFGSTTANRGDQALDLLAVTTGPSSADAYQCTGWAGPRACLTRAKVGTFEYHSEHAHYHFEDFAMYELRSLDELGQPIMTAEGLVATGGKVSFCLIDSEPDGPPSHPLYESPHPLYVSCLVGVGYQGISPGWADYYDAGLDGQQIVIDDVPPGVYALVTTIDPDGKLLESNEDDNVAWMKVRI